MISANSRDAIGAVFKKLFYKNVVVVIRDFRCHSKRNIVQHSTLKLVRSSIVNNWQQIFKVNVSRKCWIRLAIFKMSLTSTKLINHSHHRTIANANNRVMIIYMKLHFQQQNGRRAYVMYVFLIVDNFVLQVTSCAYRQDINFFCIIRRSSWLPIEDNLYFCQVHILFLVRWRLRTNGRKRMRRILSV